VEKAVGKAPVEEDPFPESGFAVEPADYSQVEQIENRILIRELPVRAAVPGSANSPTTASIEINGKPSQSTRRRLRLSRYESVDYLDCQRADRGWRFCRIHSSA